MALKVVPTKGNLISTKKQLQLAVLGYDLLDKKRNVLIKEMMSLLDDVKMVRDEITEAYQNAYDALQEALIKMYSNISKLQNKEIQQHLLIMESVLLIEVLWV